MRMGALFVHVRINLTCPIMRSKGISSDIAVMTVAPKSFTASRSGHEGKPNPHGCFPKLLGVSKLGLRYLGSILGFVYLRKLSSGDDDNGGKR